MNINQILIGAFMNAIDNPEMITEMKLHGTDVPGTGEKVKHNADVPGTKEKKFGTKTPMSEGNLRTNLDTKRIEKELEASPLAIAAGLGATTTRKRMSRLLKKSTITTQL